jgi:hypothetical protein
MVQEYEAGNHDAAEHINPGQVPVLNRSSPVTLRPVGMGTRSAAVAALQAAMIRSADPAMGVFQPYNLEFASASVAGAEGSSREMEPPPWFASTPMHALMPWG